MKTIEERLAELPPDKRALVETALRRERAERNGAIPHRDEGCPAPLSFTQELVYRIERATAGSSAYHIVRALRLAGPVDADRLGAALDELRERHHVLRSIFDERDGEPVQRVAPARSVPLPIVGLEAVPADERERELTRAIDAAANEPFDLRRDPLLRATLVRHTESEHTLVLVAHHLAWDLGSHDIALAEIARRYNAADDARRTAIEPNGASSTNVPASPLAPLPLQYGDFAAWQRERVRGERLAELLAYWRSELAGAPPSLSLPLDRPRRRIPGDAGIRRRVTLPAELVRDVVAFAERSGATPFVAFAAAFATLLHRYAAGDDVVLGCAVNGRTRPELEPLIGYFSNMLPLRVRFGDEPSFTAVLRAFRDTFLSATERAELPYEMLARELHAPPSTAADPSASAQARSSNGAARAREPALAPLFHAGFDLRHAGAALPRLGEATIAPVSLGRSGAKFDLSLTVVVLRSSASLDLKGRAELFEPATLERMLRQYASLLRAVVAAPTVPVSRIAFQDEDDARRAAVPGGAAASPENAASLGVATKRPNATKRSDATLDALFRAQVERTPEGVALVDDNVALDHTHAAHEDENAACENAVLTYAQLDERVTTLARRLRALGVGPGSGVALFAERSPEQVVAMLAILRTGAFYVPIDPDYPSARIAFMLGDAGVDIVLTLERLKPALPAVHARPNLTIVAIDAPPGGVRSEDAAPDASSRQGDRRPNSADLAYVIYTSGSTGTPKGVMVEHRSVVNYLLWMRDAYAAGPSDAVLQRAPASFDASVWELFLPLVCGARLVLARRASAADAAYLPNVLARRGISLLQLVPSQLPAVLDAPAGAEALARLRRVFLGGEALPAAVLDRLFAACPELAVTNLYGPTEATVYATHWDVDRARWRGTVLLGTPLANVAVDVRDGALQPVPVGVAGELCIAGAGLARGYLGSPALSAERFVDVPLRNDGGRSDAPRVRCYRTGDLGRMRADGTLEFIGRVDSQVKLRGVRIELGEIESALCALPEVESAAVVLREDGSNEPQLVAYCIAAQSPAAHGNGAASGAHAAVNGTAPLRSAARNGAAADGDTLGAVLRERLSQTLPPAFVPSAFVWLDAWPLTAHGKLDRAALPPPAAARPKPRTIAPPQTTTQAMLARIWARALGRDDVGISENFFELGGHSLAAMRILAQVEQQCGVHVPLHVMFEHATIAGVAAHIDAGGRARPRPSLRRAPRAPLQLH